MISFFVPGRPIPKGRPRATTFEKTEIRMTRYGPIVSKRARPRLYTPAKTIMGEENVRAAFMEKYRDNPASGPLWIKVDAVFKPPKKISRADRARMLNGEIYPESEPDIDNLLKLVMDALQGVAYKNDGQIIKGYPGKRYGDVEGIYVEIDRMNVIGGGK